MDKKKSHASTGGKHGEKKEGNFLTKTAQSIRDKVQGLTDEVKEKTQNLKQGGDSKKTKKNKDTASATASSRIPTQTVKTNSRDDSDDSDTENDSPKTGTASSATRTAQPTSRTLAATERKGDAPVSNSGNSLSKSPDDKNSDKEVPARSSSKVQFKPSVDQDEDTTMNIINPEKSTVNKGHIHINFYGVTTVDDLLDRIDNAVEKVKLIVEQGTEPVPVHIETKPSNAPKPSVADLEKRSVEKSTTDSQHQNDESIRIDYNEIHILEDILLKLNNQPGYRRVILENAPKTPESNNVQKQDNPFFGPASSQTPTESCNNDSPLNPTPTNDTDDVPPKSILKTSQDPSSLNTLTKIASFQDVQIHVNIETVQNADDQSDESTPNTFLPVESQSQEGEEQQQQNTASQVKNTVTIKKQLAPSMSLPSKKREAPKAPQPAKTQDDSNTTMPPIAISQFNNFSLVSTTKSAEKIANHEDNETTDWI